MDYIVETPRFFHCFGRAQHVGSPLGKGKPYSTMTVAFGGTAFEFGIKIAAWETKVHPRPP
jgi:hypothetical protein